METIRAKMSWFWILVFPVAFIPHTAAFAGRTVKLDAKNVRVALADNKIWVVTEGKTLLTAAVFGHNNPVPTLDHVKNYMEIVLAEAQKNGDPLVIHPGEYSTSGIELEFGIKNETLKDGDYTLPFVLISPRRIQVHYRKPQQLVLSIGGKEIIRRDTRSSKSVKISDRDIRELFSRIKNELRRAIAEDRFVEVHFASYVFDSHNKFLLPIKVSERKTADDTSKPQSNREQLSQLELDRKPLVQALKDLDFQMSFEYSSGGPYQQMDIEREKILDKLKNLDSQMDSLQEQVEADKSIRTEDPKSPRRHSQRDKP